MGMEVGKGVEVEAWLLIMMIEIVMVLTYS